jgi:Flp pilus assembly protein TadG
MMMRRLLRDEAGGPLVEATVLIPILFVFLFGSVDFLYAFSQWTAATKAMQLGARLAAVSNPVAIGLTGTNNMAVLAVSGSVLLGDAMPDFQITCNGATATCSCTRGTCSGMGTYSAAAMNTIVYGRGSSSGCGNATSYYTAGMCDLFTRITPANVSIVYDQTGLGFAGRDSGPVPTISVSLQNMTFQFFFLNGLRGFANLPMPAFTTTVTGEAMSSAAQ